MRFSFVLCLLCSSVAMATPTLELTDQPHPRDKQAWTFHVRTDRSAPVTLTCDEVGGSHERHILHGRGAELSLTVRGLKPDTAYQCRATLEDGSGVVSPAVTLRTEALPSDLAIPQIIVPAVDPAETGYILYNYGVLTNTAGYHSNYLVIIDPNGIPRWYYEGVGGGDIDASYIGNERILFGGHGPNFGPPPHYIPPSIVTLDKEIVFTATRRKASQYETRGTYHHDAGLSATGDSVFTLVNCLIDNTWRAFTIKEIDFNNTIRWSWDAVTDGVGSGVLPAGSKDDNDPYHANAVFDRFEDGKHYVYVLLRNMNHLLKIDYATKNLIWLIGVNGDFTLLEPDGSVATQDRWFFHAHDAKMYGNMLTIYDNCVLKSSYGGENYTRIARFEMDTVHMTLRLMFEYTEPTWLEPIWGGVDWLDDGNYSIASGHFWMADTGSFNSTLMEVDPHGNVVWRVEFPNPDDSIYRSEHIDGCDIFANETYCPELAQ